MMAWPFDLRPAGVVSMPSDASERSPRDVLADRRILLRTMYGPGHRSGGVMGPCTRPIRKCVTVPQMNSRALCALTSITLWGARTCRPAQFDCELKSFPL